MCVLHWPSTLSPSLSFYCIFSSLYSCHSLYGLVSQHLRHFRQTCYCTYVIYIHASWWPVRRSEDDDVPSSMPLHQRELLALASDSEEEVVRFTSYLSYIYSGTQPASQPAPARVVVLSESRSAGDHRDPLKFQSKGEGGPPAMAGLGLGSLLATAQSSLYRLTPPRQVKRKISHVRREGGFLEGRLRPTVTRHPDGEQQQQDEYEHEWAAELRRLFNQCRLFHPRTCPQPVQQGTQPLRCLERAPRPALPRPGGSARERVEE